MNIACTACSARYGVADDKLIGKRVRITCKRCGTVLIVDGNTNPPSVSASTSIAPAKPASSRPPTVEARSQAPVAAPPFTVLFADGRQEQADVAQIVRFHRSGQLGTDSLVWREGMAEWLDPWNVEEIAAAFRRMGYARPSPAPLAPAAGQPFDDDDADEEATQIVDSNPGHAPPAYDDAEPATNVVDAPPRAQSVRAAAPRGAAAFDDDDPTYVARASTSPSAAAREAQRARRASSLPPRDMASRWSEPGQPTREAAPRAQKVSSPPPSSRPSARTGTARARSTRPREQPRDDLFARQSRAGSEEEQRAEAALGSYDPDAPRLTGARNESSVLFSLDSLLKKEQPAPRYTPPPPRRDESLLVDAGASLPAGMSAGMPPALSAPDFTAPVSVAPPAPALPSATFDYEGNAARASRAWLYVLLVIAVGLGGLFAWRSGVLEPLLMKAGLVSRPPAPIPGPTVTPAKPAATEPASAPASESAVASAAAAPSAEPSTSATAARTAPANTGAAAPAQAPLAHAASTPPAHAAATAPRESTPKESASKESASRESSDTDTSSKETSAAPATGGAATPFDTAAAKEVLTSTAANAASCKEMGGPTGNGRVSITFATSGRPTSVAVTGDLAGTTVGSCVARLFRAARVPAFTGEPVTVAKSFSIE
jgi:predicted Zn finger-like uncharacterized protein